MPQPLASTVTHSLGDGQRTPVIPSSESGSIVCGFGVRNAFLGLNPTA